MKLITLNTLKKSSKNYRKYSVMVDDEDFEWLNKYNWNIIICRNTYVVTNIRNASGVIKRVFMHRFIMGLNFNDKNVVDHKDGNGLNCQKSNLRSCSTMENRYNSKSSKLSKSGLKCIYFNKKNNNWRVTIKANKVKIEVGSFINKTDAILAYNEAAKKYHGEFARLNGI